MEKIVIKERDDKTALKDVAAIIKNSVVTRLKQGLQYAAVNQSLEEIAKKLENKIILLAWCNSKLAGVALVEILNVMPKGKGKRWFNNQTYAFFSNMAVLPDFRNRGIRALLNEKSIEIAKNHNVDEILVNSALKAKDIVKYWTLKYKAQKVEVFSSPYNNFYSVRMRIALNGGKKFCFFYVAFRYKLSWLKCILTKNKYGKKRFYIN